MCVFRLNAFHVAAEGNGSMLLQLVMPQHAPCRSHHAGTFVNKSAARPLEKFVGHGGPESPPIAKDETRARPKRTRDADDVTSDATAKKKNCRGHVYQAEKAISPKQTITNPGPARERDCIYNTHPACQQLHRGVLHHKRDINGRHPKLQIEEEVSFLLAYYCHLGSIGTSLGQQKTGGKNLTQK